MNLALLCQVVITGRHWHVPVFKMYISARRAGAGIILLFLHVLFDLPSIKKVTGMQIWYWFWFVECVT